MGQGVAITGLAAPFDRPARVRGFEEVIRPGAFDNLLRDVRSGAATVRLFWAHGAARSLASTDQGSLTLCSYSAGLGFTARTDLLTDSERQILADGRLGCSIRLYARDERWDRARTPHRRSLLSLGVTEISLTRRPTYASTFARLAPQEAHRRAA
jgi:HK97 family phage prohead protease